MKDWYGAQQSISIHHRLLPEQSPGRAGQANCLYVLLNEQFRFRPTISELANIITNRKVYNRKRPNQSRKVEYFEHCSHCAEYNFTSPSQILDEVWAYPVCACHLYENHKPHCQKKYIRSGRNKNDVDNFSRYEALCVAKLVFLLLSKEVYEPFASNIFTPYNIHCNAIMEALGMMSTLEVPCCNVRAQTVMRSQGDENQAIILSAGRHFTQQSARSSLGISGLEHFVHVAITRAIHQLFIVGDIQFLSSKSDVWSKA